MQEKEKNSIIGKIILQGELECLSPLHIGCGSDERSDLDVLLDEQGNPFIPATSLIGVLRHLTKEITPKKDFKKFWGYTPDEEDERKKDPGQQSTIRCSDLLCQSLASKPVIRDGIKIEEITGMVKPGGKYDYELVERGTTFDLKMEFSYREDDATFVKNMAATIYDLLSKKHIRLGAKTTSGFGEIGLRKGSAKIYQFDFSQKEDVVVWLCRKLPEKNCITPDKLGTAFLHDQNLFSMAATFALKNALIVRSYSEDPNAPDAVHITSHKVGKEKPDWVLPGTSLKGAIRARAERIVNTIFDIAKPEEKVKVESIIKNLFGYVIENERENNKQKGRIRIEERLIENVTAEQQTRIKIDRFTGGTIESALLETMPVFSGNNDKHLEMQITVEQCKSHEIGLLLLILKDLWTGDLAVGGEKNVGRGVLQGISATLTWKDGASRLGEHASPIEIPQHPGTLDGAKRIALQGYIDALRHYEEGNNGK